MEDGNLFSVFIGHKDSPLTIIEKWNILNSHWFMNGKEAIDWKEGFPQALIGQGTTSSRKDLEGGSLSCYHTLI
jgi:hypothetical protein